MNLEQRIENLETQLTFLEDTVNTLDTIIAKQGQLIDTQQRQLQWLYRQLKSVEQGSGIEPFNPMSDIPPHY